MGAGPWSLPSVKKLMESAWYIAENQHKLNPEELVIKEAWISKDKYLFRRIYHSKGRMGIKTIPRTTLTIRLEKEDPQMVQGRHGTQKHGKYNGMLKFHWKKWKGRLDSMPKMKKRGKASESTHDTTGV